MDNNRTKGIVCILLSAFGFAVMACMIRLCDDFGPKISCFQKSFFRNFIAFIIALFAVMRDKELNYVDLMPPDVPRMKVWKALLCRSAFGTIGVFCNFYALSIIPIGEGMTLNKTAPFFTVLFSWLLLGERMKARQFVMLIVAFLGAALVMKPGFRPSDSFAAGLALLGGLGAGLAYVSVHYLGRLKVRSSLIVVFFSAFSCLASLPFIFLDFQMMTASQVLIMLACGGGAAMGQFGVTAAYRYAEPRSIAIFDYSNVIFTSIFGLLFFSQVPDALSVIGFIVIILAAAVR